MRPEESRRVAKILDGRIAPEPAPGIKACFAGIAPEVHPCPLLFRCERHRRAVTAGRAGFPIVLSVHVPGTETGKVCTAYEPKPEDEEVGLLR